VKNEGKAILTREHQKELLEGIGVMTITTSLVFIEPDRVCMDQLIGQQTIVKRDS